MIKIDGVKFLPVDVTSKKMELKIVIKEFSYGKRIVFYKGIKKALGDPEYLEILQSEKMDSFVIIAGTEQKVNSIIAKSKSTQYLSNKKLIELFEVYKNKTKSDVFIGEFKDNVIYFSLEEK